MKFFTWLMLPLCIVVAARSYGAEPSAASTSTAAGPKTVAVSPPEKPLIPTLPKCDIKFDISTTQVPVPVNESNLAVIESRYIATFRMNLPPPWGSTNMQGEDGFNYGIWFDTDIEGFPQVPALMEVYFGPTPLLNAGPTTMFPERHEIVDLLNKMAAKDRPSKGLVAIIRTPSLQVVRVRRMPNDYSHYSVAVSIYASTQDDAKRLASEFIRLYQVGLAIPEQTKWLRVVGDNANSARSDRTKLASLDTAIEGLKKDADSLSEYKDVDAAAMATYIAQRRLVDVDTAGTKAQIDACNQFLNRKNEPALAKSQIEHVEGMKIAAEVELAGLDAKRTAIVELIKKGKRRLEVLDKLKTDVKEKAVLTQRISIYEASTDYDRMLFALWQKCAVQDGKVLIQPVKWVAGKQK